MPTIARSRLTCSVLSGPTAGRVRGWFWVDFRPIPRRLGARTGPRPAPDPARGRGGLLIGGWGALRWSIPGSAELSRSLKVSDRRRNTPKLAQNRSESLYAGLWAPCRVVWAWFGFALGPKIAIRIRTSVRGPFSSAEGSSRRFVGTIAPYRWATPSTGLRSSRAVLWMIVRSY